MSSLADSKTEKVAEIIRRIHHGEIKNLLVVGCGEGIEAAILAQKLNASVVGIDIEDNFDKEAAVFAKLQTGDALALDFADETFDFVFSYHALEHIENPKKALKEIHRVLKKSGGFWIGTPNKSRIVGYIGGKNTSLQEKIKWNLADWKARLKGRFENELGAHAGFSGKELYGLLNEVFSKTSDQTKTYFSTVYAHYPRVIKWIERSGASRFVYPSVYFSGVK
ncbi:MAG TPA: class I SAM-dependent methyltransferase [Pyrinomonadaceae bacterium]|jgi:ubiquinone/menaquinone biosynthesis C-methylase UbiE